MWRLVLPLLLVFSGNAATQTLTLAAASSYRPILEAVVTDFKEANDISVRIVYGSSGKLASQIQAGAPFDIYFSANKRFMELLQDKGLVRDVTLDGYGQLALWAAAPEATALSVDSLQHTQQRIAIAQPRHAPYGQAAMQWLQSNDLNLAEQLVYAENVAQAAQMVFSGAAKFGLVALSVIPLDARTAKQLVILPAVDNRLLQHRHGIVSATSEASVARQFSDYFQQPKFDEIKRQYGLNPDSRGDKR